MKIGFVGCGNMAKAMIGGILKNKIVTADEIIASNSRAESCEKNKAELGIQVITDNKQVARESDILILSVKPQYYETVINEIRDEVSKQQLIITIAAGKTLAWMGEKFAKDLKIIRCMPNTPALVGEGMTGVCPNALVTEGELQQALNILNSFGKTQVVGENLMDAVGAVSGSSPAFVFMVIEAMADGAVAQGMPRAQAYEFAAQAVYGSAKMVLDTGKHPGELKDMVCSPGGTTIEGVSVLEDKGLRSALMEAIAACVEKSKKL